MKNEECKNTTLFGDIILPSNLETKSVRRSKILVVLEIHGAIVTNLQIFTCKMGWVIGRNGYLVFSFY